MCAICIELLPSAGMLNGLSRGGATAAHGAVQWAPSLGISASLPASSPSVAHASTTCTILKQSQINCIQGDRDGALLCKSRRASHGTGMPAARKQRRPSLLRRRRRAAGRGGDEEAGGAVAGALAACVGREAAELGGQAQRRRLAPPVGGQPQLPAALGQELRTGRRLEGGYQGVEKKSN